MIPAELTACSVNHQQSNIREERGLRMKIRSDLVEQSIKGWVGRVIYADKISVQIRIRKLQKCPESLFIVGAQGFVGTLQEVGKNGVQLSHSATAAPS
jgi:hypothetical protein